MSYVKEGLYINTNLQSVYAFANSIGMRPQQLYGSIKNGSFPGEYLQYVKVPGGHKEQPMVKIKEATEYFATKDNVKVDKAVKRIVDNPVMVADAFITMVEADNAKLGKQLRAWWDKKSATPEKN